MNRKRMYENAGKKCRMQRIAVMIAVLAAAFATLSCIALAQAPLSKERGFNAAGNISFSANDTNYITGGSCNYKYPRFVDYDSDNDLDIIAGCTTSSTEGYLMSWKNNGTAMEIDNTGLYPSVFNDGFMSPEPVDFDEDGDYDLFLGYYYGYIDYLRNTGTALEPSYEFEYRILDAGSYSAPATADIDADGDIDLYVGTRNQDTFSFFENVADEVMYNFSIYSKEWIYDLDEKSSCSLVDLDSDNDLDAVCIDDSGYSYVFTNEGNITDASWGKITAFIARIGTSDAQHRLAFADMDGDTDIDFFAGHANGTISYYRNIGSNTSYYYQLYTDDIGLGDIGVNAAPTAADIDNDGDIDLYIAEDNSNQIIFYENTGNASSFTFSGLTGIAITGTGDNSIPSFIDFSGDGLYDIALGASDGTVTYYQNTGNSTDPSWTNQGSLIDLGSFSAPGFGDIDNDGDFDMLAGISEGWVRIYYNNGTSSAPSISISLNDFIDISSVGESSPRFVDFDLDGDQDLFLSSHSSRDVYYYENTAGDGEMPVFTYRYLVCSYYSEEICPSPAFSTTAGDIDNDGDLDLYVSGTNPIYFLKSMFSEGHSINWTLENSDIAPNTGKTYAKPYLFDMDNDNDTDLVVGWQDGNISYYENTGNSTDPSFAEPVFWLDTGSTYAGPGIIDINGDGLYDLASGSTSPNAIYFWINEGTNTAPVWTRNSSYDLSMATYRYYSRPEFEDIDNDGDYDMFIGLRRNSNPRYETIYFFENIGNSQIAQWATESTVFDDNTFSNIGANAAFADFNNDGTGDIVFGAPNGMVAYLINEGTNSSYDFYLATGYLGEYGDGSDWQDSLWWMHGDAGSDTSPAAGDLTGDGIPDLVVGNSTGHVLFYRNNGAFGESKRADYPVFIKADDDVLGGSLGNEGASYSTVELIDFDEDGLYELVAGSKATTGDIYLLDNIGTAENPAWPTPQEQQITYDADYSGSASLDWTDVYDIDSDGDYDIIIGWENGGTSYIRNEGTNQEPVWVKILTGSSTGHFWIDDLGSDARPSIHDFNEDSLPDLFVCYSEGFCFFLENRGIMSRDETASNQAWIDRGVKIPSITNYDLWSGSFADIDGDGDYDFVGNYVFSGLKINLFENIGTVRNAVWQDSGLLYSSGTNYGGGDIGDIDNDNVPEIVTGIGSGELAYLLENYGNYENNTMVTIYEYANSTIEDAYVSITNDTGDVCSGYTNNKGHFSCNIASGTQSFTVEVLNATNASYARVSVNSPNSEGASFAELETLSDNFRISIQKLEANIFNPRNNTEDRDMLVRVTDTETVMAVGKPDSSGYIDFYLPQRYLTYEGEQFSQNRITYDIEFVADRNYGSTLNITHVYLPNEINISSSQDSKKLFKFSAARTMTTDGQYYGYVMYPAVEAQKNFNISDSLEGNFTFVGNVSIYYRGRRICEVSPSGNSYNANFQTAGCNLLADPVESAGDWIVARYMFSTPSLAYFQGQGWTSQQFTSEPATIRLLS